MPRIACQTATRIDQARKLMRLSSALYVSSRSLLSSSTPAICDAYLQWAMEDFDDLFGDIVQPEGPWPIPSTVTQQKSASERRQASTEYQRLHVDAILSMGKVPSISSLTVEQHARYNVARRVGMATKPERCAPDPYLPLLEDRVPTPGVYPMREVQRAPDPQDLKRQTAARYIVW